MKIHTALLGSGAHCGWWLALAALFVVGLTAPLSAQTTNELAVVLQRDGTLVVLGNAQVPPFSLTGKWTETPGKYSERYLTRHFMFMVPGESPAVELYLVHDRSGAKPDAACVAEGVNS